MKISTIAWSFATVISASIFFVPAQAQTNSTSPATNGTVSVVNVVKNYADIGLASYQDSLRTAELLRTAIEELLNNPNDETLDTAREAWRTARIPFEISEVYAQANPIVSNWVDRVNAWPIDPGFIDYILSDDGSDSNSPPSQTANIINSPSFKVGEQLIDLEKITTEVISQNLQFADGVQTNVASGYHVIEFLLWGSDNSGVEEKDVEDGAGKREATDFDLENCTNGNCGRRGEYLYAVVNLLIEDLQEMVGNWLVTGEARRALLANPEVGLRMMVSGMGSLSYGELAGRRLQNSLLVGDETSEQDRFSNNTHISYLFNARGIIGVYFGEYFSMESDYISGASIADLLERDDPALDEEFRTALGFSMARMRSMVEYARDVEAYDLMIQSGNVEGNSLILEAVYSLVELTEIIGKIGVALELEPIEFSGPAELENLALPG